MVFLPKNERKLYLFILMKSISDSRKARIQAGREIHSSNIKRF